MEIKRCTIDRRGGFADYEELKRRHVVAQGWSAFGDVSFFCEEPEDCIPSYVEYLLKAADLPNGNSPNKAMQEITHIQRGTIVLGTEGAIIKGICEIPADYCYVYDTDDGHAEYANCIYPVQWVDWKEFCDDPELQILASQATPMTNIRVPRITEYIESKWEDYKKEKGINIQPSNCDEKLQAIKAAFPQRVIESRENFLRIKREVQQMEDISKLHSKLENCHNLILTGAPGTGKTYLAWQIACSMTGDPNPMEEGNELLDHPHIDFCQFHPSMDYTDFVEGIRPTKPKAGNENIGFEGRDGIFKAFCRKAAEAQKDKEGKNYVFIIDEINRGDISKIFGELFFAIDPGYRGKKGRITTQYANLIDGKSEETNVFKTGFYVPDNVFIIGTMNDIDRGVESMDFAIRRRFAWREIKPKDTQASIFASKDNLKDNAGAKNRMDNLNDAIREDSDLGPAFQIGGAYFKKLDGDNYEALWENHLEPLLREYLRGHDKKDIQAKIDSFKEQFDNPQKTLPSAE